MSSAVDYNHSIFTEDEKQYFLPPYNFEYSEIQYHERNYLLSLNKKCSTLLGSGLGAVFSGFNIKT